MRYIILGLLRRGTPRHGYALVKEYRQKTGFRLSIGSAYRELQRLLASGWVHTASNPPGADPRRLPYAITTTGAAAFDSWLAAHSSVVPPQCHDELAVRTFFLSDGALPSANSTLALWRDEICLHRQLCERFRDEACRAEKADGAQASPLLALLLGRRLQYISADIAFIDAVRSTCMDDQGATSMRMRADASRPRSRVASPKRSSLG